MSKSFRMLEKANIADDLFQANGDDTTTVDSSLDELWTDDPLDITADPANANALAPDDIAYQEPGSAFQAQAAALPVEFPRLPRLVDRNWGEVLSDLVANPTLESCSSVGVCAVTGSIGGSSIAASLGSWASQYSSSQTLIVEANMKSPTLARLFHTSGAGLADAFFGEHEALDGLIHGSHIPNLKILPAGDSLSRRRRKASARAFWELYHALREEYPYMVIESPAADDPALDSFPIAETTDVVFLVVDPKKAGMRKVRAAVKRLLNNNARVIGCMLDRPYRLDSNIRMKRLARQIAGRPAGLSPSGMTSLNL